MYTHIYKLLDIFKKNYTQKSICKLDYKSNHLFICSFQTLNEIEIEWLHVKVRQA